MIILKQEKKVKYIKAIGLAKQPRVFAQKKKKNLE